MKYHKFCYALCQLTCLAASVMLFILAVGQLADVAELTITKLCICIGMYVYADFRAEQIQRKYFGSRNKAKTIEINRKVG